MKRSKNQVTENRTWNQFASGIKEKFNNKEKSRTEEDSKVRDMGDTHTPFSRLDLTGLNRQQAKELIEKVIDERLEQISHIELAELKIDEKERERQRAKAAERISERRNRRKQRSAESREADRSRLIDGQLSILDIIQESDKPEMAENPHWAEPEPVLQEVAVISTDESVLQEAAVISTDEPEERSAEEFPLERAVPVPFAFEQTETEARKAPQPETEIFEQLAWCPTEFGEIMNHETEDIIKPEKSSGKKSKKKSKKKTETANYNVAIEPTIESDHDVPIELAIETNVIIEPIAEQTAEFVENIPIEAAVEIKPTAEEASTTEQTVKELESKGWKVNTSLDEAIDKVFVFYQKGRSKVLWASDLARGKVQAVVTNKVAPAASRAVETVKSKAVPAIVGVDEKLGLSKKTHSTFAYLAKKEARLSDQMYRFIVTTDKGCDWFANFLVATGAGICKIYNRSKDFVEVHKKKFLIGFGCTAAAAAAITITIGSMTAYEYVYNGKVLGVVKNQEDVYKTIDIIGDKLCYEYDAEITIDKDKDIRFRKIVAFGQDLDDKEDILNRLTYMRDMKAMGHGVFVDGKMIAVLDSEDSANEILKTIQDTYLSQSDSIEYKSVGFAETVKVETVETKLGNIDSKDRALEYIMTGAVEKKIHVVQQGETFSEIAKRYGLKQSELQVSNPAVIPEKLQIGQEICLNQIVPLVTVQTVEVAQYIETIPFEVTYENTNSLYKKEQTVKSKGVNGEKDVIAEIVRNNGVEVSRKEISATILSEPVPQVVLVGTKEPPPLIGTGNLIYPIRGTLTSRYGSRWGRLHSGIDLAAPIGTKIKASDGGKVIFAGYNGSLGYMVKIDHGGGRVTLYGHCSKLFVKSGDRVYQGQHIANVGNTGRSTGPHVHFEVHINGKTKNPLNYL